VAVACPGRPRGHDGQGQWQISAPGNDFLDRGRLGVHAVVAHTRRK
jgi:hypothetical protein